MGSLEPSTAVHALGSVAESIWLAVEPRLPGLSVEVLPQIDSTNSELMRRARAGQTTPTLLVAASQSAGRGRLGKPWRSDASALTFSLGLELAPADWSGLSLAVGLAVAEALHPTIQIKWPNDLWLHERKLAGILVETASFFSSSSSSSGTASGEPGARYTVIGIGINIAPRAAEGLATPPAWLQELVPGISAAQTLERIALPLVATLQAFCLSGFAALAERYAARDLLSGRSVQLSDDRTGVAQGVSANGALLLRTATGLQAITSAEVSVRPSAVHDLAKAH